MSDFKIEVNWNDAPPEVRVWYLQQMQAAEQKEQEERAVERERRADGPVRLQGFQHDALTQPNGTIYRQLTRHRPDDKQYSQHMSEVLAKLSGEHLRQ